MNEGLLIEGATEYVTILLTKEQLSEIETKFSMRDMLLVDENNQLARVKNALELDTTGTYIEGVLSIERWAFENFLPWLFKLLDEDELLVAYEDFLEELRVHHKAKPVLPKFDWVNEKWSDIGSRAIKYEEDMKSYLIMREFVDILLAVTVGIKKIKVIEDKNNTLIAERYIFA